MHLKFINNYKHRHSFSLHKYSLLFTPVETKTKRTYYHVLVILFGRKKLARFSGYEYT